MVHFITADEEHLKYHEKVKKICEAFQKNVNITRVLC